MSESSTTRRGVREGGALVWFVLLSMVLHIAGGLGAASLPPLGESQDPDQSEAEPDKMKVTLRSLPEQEAKRIATDRQPKMAERTPETQKRQNSPTEKKKKKETPETSVDMNKKTVDQSNNEQVPDRAEYLASEANATDEQTQARKTTTRRQRSAGEQSPSDQQEARAKGGQNPAAMAARSESQRSQPDSRQQSEPPPAPRPEKRQDARPDNEESKEPPRKSKERRKSPVEPEKTRDEGDIQADEPTEQQEPRRQRAEQRDSPPMPTMGEYEKLFGGEDQERSESREKSAQGQGGPGHEMFANIDKRRGRVKAALENYLTHIKPGNHTSVNARRSVYASYINRIHRKIHRRWGGGYLPRLERQYGPGHPLSNPDLRTLLEIVVDAKSGEVEDVNIVRSSGVTSYDAEAVMIAYGTGPHPNPPEEVVSPDGNIYFHWNFWRDQKQCGTFGVTVYKRLEGGRGKKEVPPSGEGK